MDYERKKVERATSLSPESVVGDEVFAYGRIASDEDVHRMGLAYGVVQAKVEDGRGWDTREYFGGYIRVITFEELEVELLPVEEPRGTYWTFPID
jgi:hypothetical protein